MNRPIINENPRYRVWDKIEKKMHYPEDMDDNLWIITSNGVFKLDPEIKEDRWILLPRERYVIMPSLGVTDSTEKEIYEKDRVKSAWGKEKQWGVGTVEWDIANGYWGVNIDMVFEDTEIGRENAYACSLAFLNGIRMHKRFTVISNPYENPELLKD